MAIPGKRFRSGLLILCFIGITALSGIILHTEFQKKQLKQDLVALCDIKYGLFNVDAWKAILSEIVSKRVEEFRIEGNDKAQMEARINAFLIDAVNDFEQRYREDRSGLRGSLQKGIVSMTGIFEKMKEDIPVFTKQIMAFMNAPETKKAIESYMDTTLRRYTDRVPDVDSFHYNKVMERHGFSSHHDAFDALRNQISILTDRSRSLQYGLYPLVIFLIMGMVFGKGWSRREDFIVVLCSIPVLFAGLLLPMIEIDARIADMHFQLLGETVTFKDQVIYFRSKSILEVVELLITQGKADLILVGILVLLFSVIFPVLKLLMTVTYLFNTGIRNHAVVRFFVFKTAKWSMADVLVVAIFMSYIGFSGILGEQLDKIEHIRSIEALTTNRSQLLAGFYLFTSFVLLSLVISQRLQRKIEEEQEKSI